jgi:hypothetical protein
VLLVLLHSKSFHKLSVVDLSVSTSSFMGSWLLGSSPGTLLSCCVHWPVATVRILRAAIVVVQDGIPVEHQNGRCVRSHKVSTMVPAARSLRLRRSLADSAPAWPTTFRIF